MTHRRCASRDEILCQLLFSAAWTMPRHTSNMLRRVDTEACPTRDPSHGPVPYGPESRATGGFSPEGAAGGTGVDAAAGAAGSTGTSGRW